MFLQNAFITAMIICFHDDEMSSYEKFLFSQHRFRIYEVCGFRSKNLFRGSGLVRKLLCSISFVRSLKDISLSLY